MNPSKILLLGWDAADWQIIKPLLDSGAMPNLEKMIERGVMGNFSTLRPMLSPMLWNSVATGRRPEDHGILGFVHLDAETKKVRPYKSINRQTKAVWNILSQEGRRCHVINWLASHPAEKVNGVTVSESFIKQLHAAPANSPLPPNGVNPDHLSQSLATCRVRPEDIDATTIGLFVPRFSEIDQEKDNHLETLARDLAECFTIHSVATRVAETEPWDFMAVYFPTIDHCCHHFIKYRAPKLATISDREFEFYKDVIDGVYRLHDLLLGRWLQLAGDDCTVIVCSDHGYYTDLAHRGLSVQTPLGPTHEHRQTGVLAMCGPNIRKDELIHGAGLLDLTPTILTLTGLPVGEDMDGRPLQDAFTHPLPITKISSWEQKPGPEWRVPDSADVAEQKLVEQFVALGYVQAQAGNQEFHGRTVHAETEWTFACSLIYSGKFAAALPILEKIYDQYPLRFDFGCMLGECYLRLRLLKEARETVTALAESFPGRPMAKILMGTLEVDSGNPKKALEHFLEGEKLGGSSPDLFVRLGRLYFRLGNATKSLEAFDKVLELDADNALAHTGRARCLLRSHKYDEAVDAALDAVGLEFSLAEAHLALGLSLIGLGKLDEAANALEICVRFNPLRMAAHRFLISLYERIGGHEDRIRAHQKQIRDCMEVLSRRKKAIAELRTQVESRAGLRNDVRVAEVLARKRPSVRHPKPEDKKILVVSGLPRSGTSLMMQMLDRGGHPIVRDSKREADIDNPEGYFEWEEVKDLPNNRQLIKKCFGHAVKIVAPLLNYLPRDLRYKVIYMNRPIEEIATSQHKMRERLTGKPVSQEDGAKMERLLREHQSLVLKGLRSSPQVALLVVDYHELISNPVDSARRLAEFIGHDQLPQWQEMAAAIKPALYRNRSKPETSPA